MQHRRDHRACCAQPAKRREHHDGQGPAQADDHIDLQCVSALTTQAHTGAQAAQVAADQHHVRRGQGDVCTARAHGHADHAGLERQGVVDAVAHHHWPETTADFAQHAVELVFRQRLGFDITDAHVQRQAVGHALAVAGQQQLT